MAFIKHHFEKFLLVVLALICLVYLLVSIRINVFRYDNFDVGKFDLGNMSQMAWYTLHGKFMYMTDYFGTNLPRWAISHVDPILVLFIPFFAVVEHPLTLVFVQLVLVVGATFIVYLIANQRLNSPILAFSFGLSFLLYPALGFINALNGYHGVTPALVFFLAGFYCYERMYFLTGFTRKGLLIFYVLMLITMSGKEQISLYIALYGLFVVLIRHQIKHGLVLMVLGAFWFYATFLVIIPKFAHYRIAGFNDFAKLVGVDSTEVRSVAESNYFLRRYSIFGDSYGSVVVGMITQPKKLARIMFDGDKAENLKKTFEPLGYTPVLYAPLLLLAFPDLLINFSAYGEGIGTSEITNHRISMIIPVLIIASIYGVGFFCDLTSAKLSKKWGKRLKYGLGVVVLFFSIKTTIIYQNPVYMWFSQAVEKRLLPRLAFAKSDPTLLTKELSQGDRVKLTPLENKDRECAKKIVDLIPPTASVSGPDYLGAHLSMRETYAIYPGLFNSADYVIVDVFAQKLLRILELDQNLIREISAKVLTADNYKLLVGCGNLFVFQKTTTSGHSNLLPMQEKFKYAERVSYEIFQAIYLVDYTVPGVLIRGKETPATFVYKKTDSANLDAYILFLSFVNSTTGEIYQAINLPSYSLSNIAGWKEDRFYIENLVMAVPSFVPEGKYKLFIGLDNNIRTRSIYLQDITIQ